MFWKIGNSKYLIVNLEKETEEWCHFEMDGNVFHKSISGFVVNSEGEMVQELKMYQTYSISDTYSILPLYNIYKNKLYESHISQTERHAPEFQTEVIYQEVHKCSENDLPKSAELFISK